MTESCFVDTNLLVYFRDASELEKQPLAERWLSELWLKQAGRLSMQVLSEFYVTVTRKLSPGMNLEAARQDVLNLFAWKPVPIDAKVAESAWTVQDRFGFSWWDSLIVSAAQRARCTYLLTEDLQDGQDIGELKVVNPFSHSPEDLLS